MKCAKKPVYLSVGTTSRGGRWLHAQIVIVGRVKIAVNGWLKDGGYGRKWALGRYWLGGNVWISSRSHRMNVCQILKRPSAFGGRRGAGFMTH